MFSKKKEQEKEEGGEKKTFSCWLLMSTELITCLPSWSQCKDPRMEVIRQALQGHAAKYKYQLLCICKSLADLFFYFFLFLLKGSSVLISNSKLLGSV